MKIDQIEVLDMSCPRKTLCRSADQPRKEGEGSSVAKLQGYRIDCYLPDGRGEARDFKAQDDKAAVAEAEKIARWVKPVRFEVRQVTNGQPVIYRSLEGTRDLPNRVDKGQRYNGAREAGGTHVFGYRRPLFMLAPGSPSARVPGMNSAALLRQEHVHGIGGADVIAWLQVHRRHGEAIERHELGPGVELSETAAHSRDFKGVALRIKAGR